MQRPLFGREHNYIFGFVSLRIIFFFLSFRLLQIPGAVSPLPTAVSAERRAPLGQAISEDEPKTMGMVWKGSRASDAMVRAARTIVTYDVLCCCLIRFVLLLDHCLTIVQHTREPGQGTIIM